MNIKTNKRFQRSHNNAIFPILGSILLLNFVVIINCEETTEKFYDCEKYCHMDCEYISESEPHLKEQCKAVHSPHSDCSCHFGGVEMGLFITLGIFTTIILMACLLRYCPRRRRTVTNTRIVVLAQPNTVENLQNNSYNYQPSSQQNVYSIPMETKRTNYYSGMSSDQDEETTITVITNSARDYNLDFEPTSPDAPSTRIYFESSSGVGSEDQIFAPPKF